MKDIKLKVTIQLDDEKAKDLIFAAAAYMKDMREMVMEIVEDNMDYCPKCDLELMNGHAEDCTFVILTRMSMFEQLFYEEFEEDKDGT